MITYEYVFKYKHKEEIKMRRIGRYFFHNYLTSLKIKENKRKGIFDD